MNTNLEILKNETMTVYEIAKLVKYKGSHKDAMIMCETLMKNEEFKIGIIPLSLKSVTYGDNGQTTQSYCLNKRQSFALASRLNVAFLMKVVDRWQELETQKPQLPQTYSQALRELADVSEQLELQKPKVDGFDEWLEQDNKGVTIKDLPSVLFNKYGIEIGRTRLYAFLYTEGHISRTNTGGFKCFQQTERTAKRVKIYTIRTGFEERVTNKGLDYYAKKISYRQGKKL